MTTHSTTAEDRLATLGIKLPAPPEPFGTYVEAVQTGNLLFLTGMLPHGRPRGEIRWARRRGVRCGSGAQGGSPRGAQCPRCCEAPFGIARQSDTDRPGRRSGGYFWGCPRSPESRRRRFGVAARRLRKRQEPLPLGVWPRKSPARHPGRTGSDLGSAALIQLATRNFPEDTEPRWKGLGMNRRNSSRRAAGARREAAADQHRSFSS